MQRKINMAQRLANANERACKAAGAVLSRVTVCAKDSFRAFRHLTDAHTRKSIPFACGRIDSCFSSYCWEATAKTISVVPSSRIDRTQQWWKYSVRVFTRLWARETR